MATKLVSAVTIALLTIGVLGTVVAEAQRAYAKQGNVTLECERSAIAAADRAYPLRNPESAWLARVGPVASACMVSRGYVFNTEREVCGPGFAERYVAPFCYVPAGWHGWWLYVLANSNGMD